MSREAGTDDILRESSDVMLRTLLFSFLALGAVHAASAGRTVNAADFGAKPGDGINDLAALRAALAEAKKTPGATLVIPPGRYDLSDSEAVKLQDDVLAGRYGNPERRLFNRDFRYVTALDFTGAKNLTVKAAGAEFLIDGWMEPVAIQNCRDVTVEGLTIDYRRPPNSEGEIVAVDRKAGTFDVRFGKEFPVTAAMPFIRMMVYDPKTSVVCGGSSGVGGVESDGPDTLRFRSRSDQLAPGRIALFVHGFHFRPAILIYLADNTRLDDITIHANAGMGIVGHLSENITMNRLHIEPAPGRHTSTNTDATHFVSCRGLIRFDGCRFEGQGDDATNVHGFYTDIVEKLSGNRARIRITRQFETHSVKRDLPRVGDTLAVIRRETLEETAYVRVTGVEPDPKSYDCMVAYEGVLPDDFKNYTVFDITACPALEFVNCTARSHRARSVLIKTRKALVENCVFEGCTGTDVHIGAEGTGWKDLPPRMWWCAATPSCAAARTTA